MSELSKASQYRNSAAFKAIVERFKLKPWVEACMKTNDYMVERSDAAAVSAALKKADIPFDMGGPYAQRLTIKGM